MYLRINVKKEREKMKYDVFRTLHYKITYWQQLIQFSM
jgi:hypothetical protein